VGVMSWCIAVVVLNAIPILYWCFKQIGNFSYLRAMVSKCGSYLVVFLLGLCVTGLVPYLSVMFLGQLLWKIVIFSYCFYCFPFFLFFVWVQW